MCSRRDFRRYRALRNNRSDLCPLHFLVPAVTPAAAGLGCPVAADPGSRWGRALGLALACEWREAPAHSVSSWLCPYALSSPPSSPGGRLSLTTSCCGRPVSQNGPPISSLLSYPTATVKSRGRCSLSQPLPRREVAMRLHASPRGDHLKALEGAVSSLVKDELPPATPTGACGLPLDVCGMRA